MVDSIGAGVCLYAIANGRIYLSREPLALDIRVELRSLS